LAERLHRTWWHRTRHHPVTRHSGFVLRHCSRAAHRLLLVAMGVLVVGAGLAAFGVWQLAQRPIDGLWLANRLNAALTESAAPVRVDFGAVTLSWSGFSLGVDEPIDLHVSDLSLVDAANHKLATASEARLGFSIVDLIRGRIFPRSVEIEHALLILTRESAGLIEPQGDTQLRPIPLDQLTAGLHAPPGGSSGGSQAGGGDLPIPEIPQQLRRVHFRDTDIVFRDAAAKLDLRGQHMDLDVRRQRNGHIRGLLAAPVTVGAETTVVRADLDLIPNGDSSASVHVAPFRPAAMAQSEHLALLRAIDAPVTLTATASLDRSWYPAHIRASVNLGPGQLRIGNGAAPLLGGSAELSGTLAQVALSRLHLDLKRAADGVTETVDLDGTVTHASDRLTASVNLSAGHIDAADLPTLWPSGVGGGARPWVVQHVMGGIANGTTAFTVETDDALRGIVVTRAVGDLDVANAAFTWIDHMPPVEQASVRLHLIDPDTMDILLATGHQRVGQGKADLIGSDGQMRIIGLSVHDQFADLRLNVKGPVTSAIALLSEPRLKLLSAHPIGLKPNAGDVSGTLTFQFPLENKLQIDDVKIRAETHLTQVRIPGIVAQHALEGGIFDMVVDRDGLTLKGNGTVASIPIAVAGSMDFRTGPPSQVMQTITASGAAQATTLTRAGLPIADLLSGNLPFTAALEEHRDGSGVISVGTDLSDATLTFTPLAFRQSLGRSASASAVLNLQHDQLVGAERFALTGDTVAIAGSVALPAGQARQVTLDRFMLGRTQAGGNVSVAQNGAIGISLDGPTIDLSAKLTETGARNDKPSPTPPWTLNGRFDHAILAHDEKAAGLSLVASGGGDQIGMLNVAGTMETDGPAPGSFLLRLTPGAGNPAAGNLGAGNPGAGKRHLHVQVTDAGRFLRGLDTIRGLNGGRLTIDGDMPPGIGLSPLSGTASIEDVVVRNSPVLGKLLQAVTLYGLVDALRGPGMGFDRIAVPFRYDGQDLYLSNAVAENSSLGLTTSGRIGLGNRPSSLSGTIVPAYFFNALPGRIPLIGRLFSPEKGGGVFAARFGIDGPISDPNVTINPVSALTPGFLRGLFGIFDRSGSEARKEPAPETR
jgi:hypothetical protein